MVDDYKILITYGSMSESVTRESDFCEIVSSSITIDLYTLGCLHEAETHLLYEI